jgi:transcriptional regulator with GAF, ATPase, and Fis domain
MAPVSERTQLLEVKATTLSMPGMRLVVLKGPDRGHSVRLERQETVVGSAASAHLRLTDPTVSRHHLAVVVGADGVLATDLESTNGTRVEKRRVRAAYLEIGDSIEVGATRLRLELHDRRVEVPLAEEHRFGPMLGQSVAARRLFAVLRQVAPEDATVLLDGESGVGKDLAAQALHEASKRAGAPFVVFDCAAASPSLIESELFGHERGAFTGAVNARSGVFQEAHGGTLFLDEIGELPPSLQPKLLRVLDGREVRPIGADRGVNVDVRVIAATHRDLRVEVNRGIFREDLYYRLSVVPVRVPPLRERADDILLLADHFWRRVTGDEGGAVPEEHRAALIEHTWPGNVRELRNRIEQIAMLGDLAPASGGAATESFRAAKAAAVESFEAAFLARLMARASGNVSEASRLASMDRVYLTKLLRKHGLHRGAR